MLKPRRPVLPAIALLMGVLLAGLGSVENALAASPTADVSLRTPINLPYEPKIAQCPLVSERRRNDLNHIYAFDRAPLGQRTPVILVPGRAEEYQQNAWWKKVREMTYQQKFFDDHFKLYAFIYDSGHELDRQALDFNREIRLRFPAAEMRRPLVVVSYSLGGVITREAMEDPDIFRQIHTNIAIAVPFHGSPIFDPEWFTKFLRPPNGFPIRRFWDRTVYRLYLFNKTNLTRGLKWNNFDGSKPQFSPDEAAIQGDQMVSHIPVFRERISTEAIKKKMIIYASYLNNPYTAPLNRPATVADKPAAKGNGLSDLVSKSTVIPTEILGTVLPFYGFSVHGVFIFVNHQLSNLPTYSPDHPHGKNTHLYRYNDGVIPLSSMLYLPSRRQPYQEDLPGLVHALDVPLARIFVNVDHMEIGEYSRNPKDIEAYDILHPEAGKRTPNNWIFYDLERLLPELE